MTYQIYTKMETMIKQVNASIASKGKELKQKASVKFADIESQIINARHSIPVQNRTNNIPPIAYILYGGAVVSTICAIATDSKIISIVIAAACAYGGYKLSHGLNHNSQYTQVINDDISNDTNITTSITSIVKTISNDWETFIDNQQKNIFNFIDNCDVDKNKKNLLFEKISVYEIIDIKLLDIINELKQKNSQEELLIALKRCEQITLSAIDDAINKQIQKYNSLLE